MFRNYVITALRNLTRNRLYAAITIAGLAVAFAAGIFAALYVRNEVTYDRWIPGHERIYGLATTSVESLGRAEERNGSYLDAARWLRTDFPEIDGVARYFGQGRVILRHGDIRAIESNISSADPTFFDLIRVPVVAGDLSRALEEPNAIVLTRALARKYFDEDAPIGKRIDVDGHPMQVTAVIEDLPANSTFTEQGLISERAPFSSLRRTNSEAFVPTLFRLGPGASITAVESAMPGFVKRHVSPGGGPVSIRFYPLVALHLFPFQYTNDGGQNLVHERAQLIATLYGTSVIALLIIAAAAFNFVNATTARANRRAIEVGVRKASGAGRRQLMVQFLGENILHTLAAMLVGVGLVAVLLPRFQALFDRAIPFSPLQDPTLAGGTLGIALLTGLLAGFYPAGILSSLRPAVALKPGLPDLGGSGLVRQGLVTLQFAILISISVITAAVYQQTSFAMNENLRFDKDQVLTITGGCLPAVKAQIQALAGVRAAGCGPVGYNSRITTPDGTPLGEWTEEVDFDFFHVLGLKPIAGRFPSQDRGEDTATADTSINPSVVINESAVRSLGFASPADAVGKLIPWKRAPVRFHEIDAQPLVPSRIIGVVADISGLYESVSTVYIPRMYYVDTRVNANNQPGFALQVKLTGREIPETLRAIDGVWDRVGNPAVPVQRMFMDQRLNVQYRNLQQQERLVAVLSCVALFIAALGLFGLAAYTAERRTKEMGVRRALGADRKDILRLMLWEFIKPVLWANAIAWPTAYLLARQWLESFAHHVDLDPMVFLGSSALALVIALTTVAGQALLVARARPAAALRYE